MNRTLNIVISGEATEEYPAGWASGDLWCSQKCPDLYADAPAEWSDEKCAGFWARLAVERKHRAGRGGPCTVCREFTEHADYGSSGPYNCGKTSCIPF